MLITINRLGLLVLLLMTSCSKKPANKNEADLIVYNALITTLNDSMPEAQAIAVRKGKIIAIGEDKEILALKGDSTKVLDAAKKRMIPGLNDSHCHYLRGGTSFTLELRWDGIPSLREGLARIKQQAEKTPAGEWIRVVGGFSPYQFSEKRLPTPEELTVAAPDVPVFVQYFYSTIILNKKAIETLNLNASTEIPHGTIMEKDANGNPTGVVIADPSPTMFYSLLGQLPKADEATAENSTQYMFRELARFGLTSVIDAGGGGFDFPNDYKAPMAMMKAGKLPLRVSFYLFTQHPGKELEDYQNWMKSYHAGQNLDEQKEHGFELDGGGEWVLWKAGDYENFRSPRPTQGADMEKSLEPVVELFVKNRWPFRIHATYNESITRLLNVIEKVNSQTPLNGLRWSIEHAETIKELNMDRIKKLGGGVAIQDRMYFLGDDFIARYGKEKAGVSPPVKALVEKGIPVGMGTDGTRSSFNPWLGLYFLVSGRVASGTAMLDPGNRLTRAEALKLYSHGSAWFSQEDNIKGILKVGMYADFALLSKDYMEIEEDEIKTIEADLTVVGGNVVYASNFFEEYQTQLPPIKPSWSPLSFGSFYNNNNQK